MIALLRILCVTCWCVLTALLVTRDPLGILAQEHQLPIVLTALSPVFHLIAFTGLTLVTLAARWRIGLVWQIVVIALYALATECIQAIVPQRVADLNDLVQNLGGIAAGMIFWHAIKQIRTVQ